MTLKELKENLKDNMELLEKIKATNNLDEVVKLAKTVGITVTKDELQEIDDDDLEAASGGNFDLNVNGD